MSRITAFGFVMLDAALSALTIVQSSLTFVAVLCGLLGSIVLAMLSRSVRSLLCPTYFWDEPRR